MNAMTSGRTFDLFYFKISITLPGRLLRLRQLPGRQGPQQGGRARQFLHERDGQEER